MSDDLHAHVLESFCITKLHGIPTRNVHYRPTIMTDSWIRRPYIAFEEKSSVKALWSAAFLRWHFWRGLSLGHTSEGTVRLHIWSSLSRNCSWGTKNETLSSFRVVHVDSRLFWILYKRCKTQCEKYNYSPYEGPCRSWLAAGSWKNTVPSLIYIPSRIHCLCASLSWSSPYRMRTASTKFRNGVFLGSSTLLIFTSGPHNVVGK